MKILEFKNEISKLRFSNLINYSTISCQNIKGITIIVKKKLKFLGKHPI